MTGGRKGCLSGDERCDPKTEREALYHQGTHNPTMTRTEIAEAMGVSLSALSGWLDPHGTQHIPEERKAHLLRLTDDDPTYLRYLGSLQGFVVYDPKTAGKNVTRMVSEFGDLLKAIDARADGTSPEDAARIEREGTELIAAVRIEIEHAREAVTPLRVVK